MKFIQLTDSETGNERYICADKITAIYKHDELFHTIVHIAGDSHCCFWVKESISEVMDKIKEVR